MTWYEVMNIENRMVVEGHRYQEELYSRRDEDDEIYYCDVCECEDCPRYGDDCDGNGESDDWYLFNDDRTDMDR